MNTVDLPRARTWFREPWPWLLMLPPAAAVAGGFTMLWLAIATPAELAVADYSRIEEITEARFARDERAALLDLAATVHVAGAADGRIAITVTLDGAQPATLRLVCQHIALRASDRTITLPRTPAGTYEATVELAGGRYDLELSPPDGTWRLAGTLATVPQSLQLVAQAAEEAPK
jgi:hypothetical protein